MGATRVEPPRRCAHRGGRRPRTNDSSVTEPDSLDSSSDAPPSLGRSPSEERERPDSVEDPEIAVEWPHRVPRRGLGVLGHPRGDLGRSLGVLGERLFSSRHPTPGRSRSSRSPRTSAPRALTLSPSRRRSARHLETLSRSARTSARHEGTLARSRRRVAEDSETLEENSSPDGRRLGESGRRPRENVRGLGEDV